MHWWEDYTAREGAEMNANPSPGNKAGGLTTILEKSLGAMAKAGTTNLVDVYRYAEPVTAKGFVFMDTPGYDPVAATGQVAGGANLVCFTTGRGSVFGMKPAPSIKLATNTAMYERLSEDMDINCGTIVSGEESVAQCGERIFELMLRTASGEPTKSEAMGFGAQEFAPWVLGRRCERAAAGAGHAARLATRASRCVAGRRLRAVRIGGARLLFNGWDWFVMPIACPRGAAAHAPGAAPLVRRGLPGAGRDCRRAVRTNRMTAGHRRRRAAPRCRGHDAVQIRQPLGARRRTASSSPPPRCPMRQMTEADLVRVAADGTALPAGTRTGHPPNGGCTRRSTRRGRRSAPSSTPTARAPPRCPARGAASRPSTTWCCWPAGRSAAPNTRPSAPRPWRATASPRWRTDAPCCSPTTASSPAATTLAAALTLALEVENLAGQYLDLLAAGLKPVLLKKRELAEAAAQFADYGRVT